MVIQQNMKNKTHTSQGNKNDRKAAKDLKKNLPKKVVPTVSKVPRCLGNARAQRSKVQNDLQGIVEIDLVYLGFMMCLQQIQERMTLGRKFLKSTLHVTPSAKNRQLFFRDAFFFFLFLFFGKGMPCICGDITQFWMELVNF